MEGCTSQAGATLPHEAAYVTVRSSCCSMAGLNCTGTHQTMRSSTPISFLNIVFASAAGHSVQGC